MAQYIFGLWDIKMLDEPWTHIKLKKRKRDLALCYATNPLCENHISSGVLDNT